MDLCIAALCRHAVLAFSNNPSSSTVVVDEALLAAVMGSGMTRPVVSERLNAPGIAVGLVWTEVGGDILFVEVRECSK